MDNDGAAPNTLATSVDGDNAALTTDATLSYNNAAVARALRAADAGDDDGDDGDDGDGDGSEDEEGGDMVR